MPTRTARGLALALSLLLTASVCAALTTGGPASAAPDRPARPDPLLPSSAHGEAAVTALGDRLAVAAERNGLTPARLRTLLRTDDSVWVDHSGRVYYVDPVPRRSGGERTPVGEAPYPLDQTFLLHSKPGSQRTIFLDFDGATVSGTGWNTGVGSTPNGSHPAWDLDGNPAAFNAAEREAIQAVWQYVAEDYAAFDVDVTTQDPGAAAITRSGAGDPTYGSHALITPSDNALNGICGGGCGGVAYIGVFDEPDYHAYYQPAWVFPQALSNDVKNIAEAASHEVGHNLGLEHDGVVGGPGYYRGHGAWAPIMGVGYDRPIAQWSKGEYAGANNTQDDIAVMAGHGVVARADEAGNSIASAAAPPTGTAYISTRTDVDVYDLGTCSGPMSVTASPWPVAANLDIELRLLDAAGALVETSNPAAAMTDRSTATGLGASISRSATGRHYARVDGIHAGANPSVGYSDYGSLGAYTLQVTGCGGSSNQPPSAPQNLSATSGPDGTTMTVQWSPPASSGSGPVTGYTLTRTGSGGAQTVGAGATSYQWTGLAVGTTYTFTVAATSAAGTGPVASVSGTTTSGATPPGIPTGVGATVDHLARSARISWAPPTSDGGAPITGYQVFRDGSPVATLAPGARSHDLTALARGGSYVLGVRALNSKGSGPLATAAVALAGAPGTPTNLRATVDGTTVQATWGLPAGFPAELITGWTVTPVVNGTPGSPIALDSSARSLTGTLAGGNSILFRIRAESGDVSGVTGQTNEVTTLALTKPGKPGIKPAKSGWAGGSSTAKARWRPPTSTGGSEITGYQVFAYRLNGKDRTVQVFTTSRLPASLRAVDLTLPRGRYRFAVRAQNSEGWGKRSAKSNIVRAR